MLLVLLLPLLLLKLSHLHARLTVTVFLAHATFVLEVCLARVLLFNMNGRSAPRQVSAVSSGQRATTGAAPARPVPLHRSAASSHQRNDAYMEEFDRAYEEIAALRLGDGSAGGGSAQAAGRSDLRSSAVNIRARAGGGGSSSSTSASGTAMVASGRSAASSSSAGVASSARAALPPGGGGSAVPDGAHPCSQTVLGPAWWSGPVDPAGSLADLSDRPLMAMATDPLHKEVAIAGSDHAVYTVDMATGRKQRTLYGGKYGHSEWVTGVCYVGDGSRRVVSAGMDAKLCVWDARPSGKLTACRDLLGHFGSVSLVQSPGGGTPYCGAYSSAYGHLLWSAGYDKTVRLWDSISGACLASVKQHAAPVLSSALCSGPSSLHAVTGDRDGVGYVWDLSTSRDIVAVGKLQGHRGHMTACQWLSNGAGATPSGSCPVVLTGAQDGHLRAWDMRAPPASACIADVAAHTAPGGSGAVGDIAVVTRNPGSAPSADDSLVVTAGADKRLVVIDPRAGWSVSHASTDHRDFIYTLWATGDIVLSGAGDGVMLAHRLSSGDDGTASMRLLWGLGANAAAVRCIGTAGKLLTAAGDDGKALSYVFS